MVCCEEGKIILSGSLKIRKSGYKNIVVLERVGWFTCLKCMKCLRSRIKFSSLHLSSIKLRAIVLLFYAALIERQGRG